jgi:hypothetical protein
MLHKLKVRERFEDFTKQVYANVQRGKLIRNRIWIGGSSLTSASFELQRELQLQCEAMRERDG